MAASATQNLSESLDLIKCTIEAILNKEMEFQRLMAQEIATMEEPEEYVCNYQKSETMVKLSYIRSGETVGVCSTGEAFTEEELDFSAGGWLMACRCPNHISIIWGRGHTVSSALLHKENRRFHPLCKIYL